MNKRANLLLAAGLLSAGFFVPLSASAHAEDAAVAFAVGAAVGRAFDDDRRYVRHYHAPFVRDVHRGHGHRIHPRWRAKHYRWHDRRGPKHWAYHGYSGDRHHLWDGHNRPHHRDRWRDQRGRR